MTVRCVVLTLLAVAAVSGLLNLLGLFGDEGRAKRARIEADGDANAAARARSIWGLTDEH